jgi:hypothetical protein
MNTPQKASKESYLIVKFVSVLSLIYLTIVPSGYIKKEFNLIDIIILVIVLLFNSELLERLINLVINKDGITINLKEFKQEQDKQKEKIEVNRNNIEANKNSIEAITNIIQRLTVLEQELANSTNTTNSVINSLLNPYEWQHLLTLASNEPFNYHKQHSFEQELRHLRTLGFIASKPGIQISHLPERGDLRNFFNITEQGEKYVVMRKKVGVEDSTIRNNKSI